MTQRFTAHEPRPNPRARPKEPAPVAAKVETSGEPGKAKETGGPSGPEPTRYGDWERKGICVDF
jgi:hypothetical protein